MVLIEGESVPERKPKPKPKSKPKPSQAESHPPPQGDVPVRSRPKVGRVSNAEELLNAMGLKK